MAYTQEQYTAALNQLDQNISTLNQQLTLVEQASGQAIFQKHVSTLFLEMNVKDREDRSVILPVSKFVHAVHNAAQFYKLEALGEITLKVTRDHGIYKADSRCYFMRGELEEMTKEATWGDNYTEIKVAGYRASPAFFFPGCEPTPVVSVEAVTATHSSEHQTPQGAHEIHVGNPTGPTVPVELEHTPEKTGEVSVQAS